MKKIVYLIISIISFSFIFLINFIFNKYTNLGIVENVSKIFLAWDLEETENKRISLEDENISLIAETSWVDKNIAEVTFSLGDNLQINEKDKDVIFMFDTSSSIEGSRLNDFVSFSLFEMENVLKNENNKVAIITFSDKAELTCDFTNDIEDVKEFEYNLELNDNTNYNAALNKLDELLSTYEKKEDRDLVVIFLSDGESTKDVKSHKATYEMLKEKYSYLSINGILYGGTDNKDYDINDVSDTQYVVNDFDIVNAFSKIINNGSTFDKFKILFSLTPHYEVVGFDTKTGNASVNEDNVLIWDMSGKHLVGGYDELKVRLKLKSKFQNYIGYYQINDNLGIEYKLGDIEKTKEVSNSLKLRSGFEVSYKLNLPSGCSISNIGTELYTVYSKVDLKDDLYCEGYEFLGYKIDDVEMINSKSFIMPGHSVIINASWSSNGVVMELDGTIREKTTLYDRIEELSQTTSIVKQYTGEHKDSYVLPATKNIYHFYASDDTEASEVLTNNNVLFADHCWQILRTTDTGGVKLIYNGEPDANGKCGTDRGNHVGFNNTSEYNLSGVFYYGTDYVYDSINNRFTLAGEVKLIDYIDENFNEITGKYTCVSYEENSSCETLAYVYNPRTWRYADVIELNSNSLYSQFGTLQFNAASNSPAYVGYMYGDVYENNYISLSDVLNYKFGTSFIKEGENYLLVDPVDLQSTSDTTTLSTHHYFCLEEGVSTCSSIGYAYYGASGRLNYIILNSNDTNVNDVLDKMLRYNTNNSTIKTGIDAWYEKHLINYEDYLEDTIYCSDRSITNFDVTGWNMDGGNVQNNLHFTNNSLNTDLSCSLETDQFSTKNNKAKLDYPIGLATITEMNLLNNTNVRKTGKWYWLGTPNIFSINKAYVRSVGGEGGLGINRNSVIGDGGVRPVVSLASGIEYTGGDGSVDSPYVIE